jgi:hypothetical protein
MRGNALLDFIISIILLLATGAVFFIVIDRMAPDPLLNKIGKIAVGVVLLIVFLLAVKGVLFGGGGAVPHLAPQGFLWFCIGVIVILVVLFIIEFVLTWIAGAMGAEGSLVQLAKYVIFAIALIALLVVADRTLIGGNYSGAFNFNTPAAIGR